jgi:hypothetical protein
MGNRLKGRALLAILVSTCVLAILVPTKVNAVRSMLAPVSIYTTSDDFALLYIPSTTTETLFAPKPNRNDAYANSISAKHAVTLSQIYRYSISDPCAFSDHASGFDSIFRRALQQACLLLDVPPPSLTVS